MKGVVEMGLYCSPEFRSGPLRNLLISQSHFCLSSHFDIMYHQIIVMVFTRNSKAVSFRQDQIALILRLTYAILAYKKLTLHNPTLSFLNFNNRHVGVRWWLAVPLK